MRFICSYCHAYAYEESKGDPTTSLLPGTTLAQIPDDWRCPICGKGKEYLIGADDQTFSQTESIYETRRKGQAPKDIDYYRSIAREMLKGVCGAYSVCDGGPDKICYGQKFGKPIGFGGAGQGTTFHRNWTSLQSYRLLTRIVKPHHEPEMSRSLFGQRLAMPVAVASMSGVKNSMNAAIPEEDFYRGVLKGARSAGTIAMVGNTADVPDDLGVRCVAEAGGQGVPVFKPQVQERLLQLFREAEAAKAPAVGVDLDGCGSVAWSRAKKPVCRKTEKELKELVGSVGIPVFFKGVMSMEDAAAVADAGASAIYVSNHGGRVLDSGLGVADVLPSISKEFHGKVVILADGCVRTGYDVLKVLALGADVALIGRPLARMSLAGGGDAVKLYLDYVKSDLRMAMIMTGCNDLKDAGPGIITKV
ncbi:MAG TPA: alpha-hydroxy-acid oxidizing protein [Methanomassiliicoccales archaeon]|nr:alpha-hydroxy-acid oxidizing protein [Methanomassiliicoccales archaeon]